MTIRVQCSFAEPEEEELGSTVEEDSHTGSVSFCPICGFNMCPSCWSKQLVHGHKQLRKGHEKLEPILVQRISQCTAAPKDQAMEVNRHHEDQDTTWFSIRESGNEDEPLTLTEHLRFRTLMWQTSSDEGEPRYPALVAFVGDTGEIAKIESEQCVNTHRPCRHRQKHIGQSFARFGVPILRSHS
jgi:hypothetical protein